jgi:hypothetical protein
MITSTEKADVMEQFEGENIIQIRKGNKNVTKTVNPSTELIRHSTILAFCANWQRMIQIHYTIMKFEEINKEKCIKAITGI